MTRSFRTHRTVTVTLTQPRDAGARNNCANRLFPCWAPTLPESRSEPTRPASAGLGGSSAELLAQIRPSARAERPRAGPVAVHIDGSSAPTPRPRSHSVTKLAAAG